MRKTIGIILLALGVIALAAAFIVREWVAPNVVKLPDDTKASSVAEGTGSGFDLATSRPFQDVPLTATRQLTTDTGDSDSDNVVWNMHVKLTDPTGNALTDYRDRVAVDRKKVTAVNEGKYKEQIDDARFGVRKVKHEGYTYHFKFDTGKKDYQFFDANTGKAFPAKYQKEEKIDGTKVYKFTQEIPATKVREAQLPGAAIGSPEPVVTADVYYTNVRNIWVEPTSGWIVKASEDAKTTLRAPGTQQDALVVLANKLTFTDKTVDNLMDRAKNDRDDIKMIQDTVPLWTLIVGIVLVLVGLLLILLPSSGGGSRGAHSAP